MNRPMERIYSEDPNSLKLTGIYTAKLYGPDGALKTGITGKNVVCTNGKEWLANFLHSAALAAATNTARYIAIGSDSTTEAAANTALGTELARHTGTVSYVSNQIYQITATFATGSGTGNVYEYGLLTSSAAGTLISRDTEALITKGASDKLTVTYQLTLS